MGGLRGAPFQSFPFYHLTNGFSSLFRPVKSVAPAALFLAAKVEEQPRKLDYVIKVAHACLHPQEPPPDTRSEVSGGGGILNHSHGDVGILRAMLCVLGWSEAAPSSPTFTLQEFLF